MPLLSISDTAAIAKKLQDEELGTSDVPETKISLAQLVRDLAIAIGSDQSERVIKIKEEFVEEVIGPTTMGRTRAREIADTAERVVADTILERTGREGRAR
jgi:hypothetical protein